MKITTGASLMPAQIPHGRMSSNRSMVCSSTVQFLLSGLKMPALHRGSAVACKDLSRAHVLEEVDGLL